MKKMSIIGVLVLVVGHFALAADDPSIDRKVKKGVQASMKNHIESQSAAGSYAIFDPDGRRLVGLKLKKLHSGVVTKGGLFVSCADFVDKKGTVYDVDFLVRSTSDGYQVVESLIHSKGGIKSPYDMGH